MSKLESGEIVLGHEPIDLNRLSAEVMTIISQRAAESGITMEMTGTLNRFPRRGFTAVPCICGRFS